jgi:hypothetical protein
MYLFRETGYLLHLLQEEMGKLPYLLPKYVLGYPMVLEIDYIATKVVLPLRVIPDRGNKNADGNIFIKNKNTNPIFYIIFLFFITKLKLYQYNFIKSQ